MIFQSLGHGPNAKVFQSESSLETPGAWKYSPAFCTSRNVKYASVYAKGKSLTQVCPPQLASEWAELSAKMSSHHNAALEAKICLKRNDFFDLLPVKFVESFITIKNKITEHVLTNYEEPTNYNFLSSVHEMLEQISNRQLQVDSKTLACKRLSQPTGQEIKNISPSGNKVVYDQFKSRTGRLTTKKGSFPILNLKKGLRSCIVPTNDLFVEYDMNAAEIRTLLGLANKEQPTEDIHDWNTKNIFKEDMSRQQAKQRVFSWMYNIYSADKALDDYYDRRSVLDRFWDGQFVTTDFGRSIASDEFRALNYLLQSTTSDIVLENAVRMNNILKDRKSFLAFTMHDSVVLDFCRSDRHLLEAVGEAFSSTRYGKFKTSVSVGKNFGEMREVA